MQSAKTLVAALLIMLVGAIGYLAFTSLFHAETRGPVQVSPSGKLLALVSWDNQVKVVFTDAQDTTKLYDPETGETGPLDESFRLPTGKVVALKGVKKEQELLITAVPLAATAWWSQNADIFLATPKSTKWILKGQPGWTADDLIGNEVLLHAPMKGEFWVLNRMTGDTSNLFKTGLSPISAVAWSPDGQRVAFSGGLSDGEGIWVFDRRTRDLRQETTTLETPRVQGLYWLTNNELVSVYYGDTLGCLTLDTERTVSTLKHVRVDSPRDFAIYQDWLAFSDANGIHLFRFDPSDCGP